MVETMRSVDIKEFKKTDMPWWFAVNGPLSAGKTTLVEFLSGHYGINVIPENYEANPHLKDFYEHPKDHAYRAQLFFLEGRGTQIMSFKDNPLAKVSGVDQSIEGNECFELAQYRMGYISKPDHESYLALSRVIKKSLPPIKAFLVPLTSAGVLINRMYNRKRDFEINALNKYEKMMTKYIETLVDTFKEWVWINSARVPVYEMNLRPYLDNPVAENHLLSDVELFLKSRYSDVPFLNK